MRKLARKNMLRALRAIRGDERGVALVEFALVLPVMIVIFIGLVEFSEAFTVSRKLSSAAGAVSDLVAQESSVTNANLNDIEEIAGELMQPYSDTPLTVVIVSVVADQDNATTVAWSFPVGAYAVGTPYNLPRAGLTEAGSSLIVTEASYNFTPTISRFLGTFQINQRAFFRPRFSVAVTKLD